MPSLSIRVARKRLGDLASVHRSVPLDLGLAYIKTDVGSYRVLFFYYECFCFRLYDILDALITSGEWSFELPASEIS
ncbi:hypothetical protein LB504_011783 [Fusarium proliferatum]|nr:hypothetical protein LB504_011783 [Fusarium proliferatum]